MELDKVIKNRRSHREFEHNLVSNLHIDKLVEAFSLAPTSCNLQLSYLVLVNDKKILSLMKKNVTGKIDWTNQLFVLVINNSINYGNSAQKISAGMATQNLMLKAEDINIGTCPIAGFGNKKYLKKLLKVPNEYDIPLLIFFGYKKYNKNNILITPYRASKKLVFSKNIFSNNLIFKKTNDLRKWTFQEVMEYRKRIFSVYYPRFKHGLWRNSIDLEFKSFLKKSNKSDVLCYYFWEKGFLDLIEDRTKIYVYDDLVSYSVFLNSNFNLKISEKFDNMKLFKSIFLANTLEFSKNRDECFKDISLKLDADGIVTILYFNYNGLFSLFFRFLNLVGILGSVYENSPFYKVGPYSFIKNHEIKNYLNKNNLKIQNKSFLRTTCLEDKFNNKLIKWVLNKLNYLFPENIKLEVIKN
jgi:nitroreductase